MGPFGGHRRSAFSCLVVRNDDPPTAGTLILAPLPLKGGEGGGS